MLRGRGRRVAVITNDQGIRLVDGGLFQSLGIPSREVVNGCFCCHYDDLDNCIDSLVGTDQPEVIFAESVGSCTDLVATVLNPLLRYRRDIDLSVFADARLLHMMLGGHGPAFDPSVRYIYFKQLEEAGIIVISKTDLLAGKELDVLQGIVGQKFAGKKILWQNSYDEGHIGRWLEMIEGGAAGEGLKEIDYAIYGEGEARLAWLDEEVRISGVGDAAGRVATVLARSIYERILTAGYPIGHLKFLLDGKTKISWVAGEGRGMMGVDDLIPADEPCVERADLLINARVQTDPELLKELVGKAIMITAALYRCSIAVVSERSFQPGFPVPTHRIPG